MTITVKIKEAKFMPEKYSAFLSFPYNIDIIDEIRSFKYRSWNKETKEWEITIKELGDFIYTFYDCVYDISGRYVDLSPKVAKIPDGFEFKTKPFQHQIEGFNFGLVNDKWLLADEQGLGKTKQVIDIAVAKKLECGYKHCFIICGVNGLKWNWYNEIHTHSNEGAYILGQRKKRNGTLQISSNKDKLNDIYKLSDNENYFIITNVESLRDDSIREALEQSIQDGEINMIAADEIHKCLGYDTPILTDSGYIRIGDIVTNKLNVSVYSYNEVNKQIELKPIVDYHENLISRPLIRLKFETDRGIKEIRCTPDHKLLTSNRGWVEAVKLTKDDDVVEFNS